MIEVERKFDVNPGFVLPALARPDWLVSDRPPVELAAIY